MYSRRVDTSDRREQVYETKLLSLFNCRAVQDDTIEQFKLDFIWEPEFADFYFNIEIKGHDKPGTVFVQILHKTNKKHIHKINLAAYFDSYMEMKDIFCETELLFVIYTNANVDTQYIDASARSVLTAKLNDILDTGGNVKCPNNEENIEYLIKKSVKDQISLLAKMIANYIDNKYFHMMLNNELILRYHVILARKVFDVLEIQPESEATPQYRIASIRQDFFDNTEEHMVLFRTALYLEIIKGRKLRPPEIQLYLSEFLSDPTDATRLSKLIGTVVTYNNGQLEFDKTFRTNMKPMDVPRATVDQAIKLAETETLSSVKLKVPTAFGNKDLTISGSDVEIEERICHLATKMKELLDKCEASKIVTINESMEEGFLQLNGGIAGAIGNIFVLDDNTKLLKITDNWKSLSTLAQRLYKKLSDVIDNLHECTFCFKVDKFPVLSFDSYGEKIVKYFLNNLLVYCNQAEENDVQEILKNEIEDLQRNQPNYFQIKSDVILIRYHNEIQKWHMKLLQENFNLFRQSIDKILFNSLINLISEPYINKIKQYDYTFTKDAVRSLNLPDQPSSTMIVTENCVLTVVKVMQHLKNKQEHFVVLDVEYIASLPANDQHALRAELRNTNQQDVLILICDKINYIHEQTLLRNIANAVRNKTIIVILNQNSLGILRKYFPETDNILHDKKFSLIDVDVQSQKSILNDATAVFPGVEIGLGVFLRGWPRTSHARGRCKNGKYVQKEGGTNGFMISVILILYASTEARVHTEMSNVLCRSLVAALQDLESSATGSHDSDLEHTLMMRKLQEVLEKIRSLAARVNVMDSIAIDFHDPDLDHTIKRKLEEFGETLRSLVAALQDLESSATGSHDSGSLLDEIDKLKKSLEMNVSEIERLLKLRKAMESLGMKYKSDQHEGYGVFPVTSCEPTRALSPIPASTFNGPLFYNMFKDAEFLKSDANVQEILAQGHELREKINTLEPGKTMIIEEMNLTPNTSLMIKKDGGNIKVYDFEFTYNRLVGLTAAYVYENRKRFPNILATEAEELGLEWDQNDDEKCKLYLSAVSGTEYFIDQFSYWPLVCGLRKYQLKKLPVDEVLKMGTIRNAHRQTMARVLDRNLETAVRIWCMIPDTSVDGLHTLMKLPELKNMFVDLYV